VVVLAEFDGFQFVQATFTVEVEADFGGRKNKAILGFDFRFGDWQPFDFIELLEG